MTAKDALPDAIAPEKGPVETPETQPKPKRTRAPRAADAGDKPAPRTRRRATPDAAAEPATNDSAGQA